MRGERGSPKMNLQTEPLHLKEVTVTCIPRLRSGGVGRRSRRGGSATAAPAQVSVLDRLRDVVLRLAVLSAATPTKHGTLRRTATATTPTKHEGTLRRTATAATPSRAEARVTPASAAPYADSYRSEAVDDCIQFLKRSAAGGGAPAAAVEVSTVTAGGVTFACAPPREP